MSRTLRWWSAYLLLTGAALAQEPNFAGHWAGTLTVQGGDLRLVIHIEQTPAGTWRATFDSIDQGAAGLPVSRLTLAGRRLSLAMEGLQVTYEAELDATGNQLVGTFKQREQALPLTLTRTETPPQANRPQTPKPPFPYEEQEVTFSSKPGVMLAGTLTIPRGNGPFGAVVLVSGSGPQDRNETLFGHEPFRVMADHLSRFGIVVLRYDDRGVGRSTGDFATATTKDFADDAAAAVNYLRTVDATDPGQVMVIGHSEGGLVAPLVATMDPELAGIVLLAGPGVDGAAITARQTSLLLDQMGVAPDAKEKILAARQATIERLLAGGSEAILKESLKPLVQTWLAAEGGDESPASIQRRIDELTAPWMRFFLTHEPAPVLARVACPVLALNGALDTQVDAGQNLPAIVAALESGTCTDYTVVKLPKLNHLFQTATTGSVAEYGRIQETLSPRLLNTMTGWILARMGLLRGRPRN